MIRVNLIVHAFSRCVTNTRREKQRERVREGEEKEGKKGEIINARLSASRRFPKIAGKFVRLRYNESSTIVLFLLIFELFDKNGNLF